MERNRALCCGFGVVGASMAGQQWKKRRGGVGGGGDNAERMPGPPRRVLLLLSRATDEPQMDGQLLWVSEPREVGVTEGRCVCFEGVGMQVKGAPLREGVDSRPNCIFTLPLSL